MAEPPQRGAAGTPDPRLFSSFAKEAFYPTPTWSRLRQILRGNGGAFGLYGPRGSGKSWLMLMAIEQAENGPGMGLWFPCPSGEHNTDAFLSSLSDNLANAVEKRFVRNNIWSQAARRAQFPLVVVAVAPVAVAIVTYVIRGFRVKDATGTTIFSSIPEALWIAVGTAVAMLFILLAGKVVWENRPVGRLVREATALRERIRFTTAMNLGSEIGLSGGAPLAVALRHKQERSLDERPTTTASLIFDFRNLAKLIVVTTKAPLIIGIDELDKLEDPLQAREILRDIKSIFEITNVFFLVSVSEEAATALHLGSLQTGGRNEFNSSFYTVLELPPLSPEQTKDMLEFKHTAASEPRAKLLCLLGAGNWREILRLADSPLPSEELPLLAREQHMVLGTLEAEAAALLRQVVIAYGDENGAEHVIASAWQVLRGHGFASIEAFAVLSRSALHDLWQPAWADNRWDTDVREPWRRFLIRLFVAGAVIAPETVTGAAREFSAEEIADLRGVLIMSASSAAAAKLMLKSRFGDQLDRSYSMPAEMRLVSGAADSTTSGRPAAPDDHANAQRMAEP